MTDITAPALAAPTAGTSAEAAAAAPAATSPARRGLVAVVELLFFAYRDFTGEADAVLEEIGLGRAHHRVLHFVNRNPGLRVADLLGILKITKQSLARVLKQLVDEWPCHSVAWANETGASAGWPSPTREQHWRAG